MEPAQALSILSMLANGINPDTGEILEMNGPYQSANVVRALYTAIRAVEANIPKAKRASKNAPNARMPWTDAEDQQLLAMFDKGLDLTSIATHHGRTVTGIQARLERHGRLATHASWRPGMAAASSSAPLDRSSPEG